MKRAMIVLVLSVVASVHGATQAPVYYDIQLQVTDPASKKQVTVLHYRGENLGKALAGGNKLKDTKTLNEFVKVDNGDPRKGTIQWTGFSYEYTWDEKDNKGQSSGNSGIAPLTLHLTRKDKDAKEWQLTDQAIKTVQEKLPKQRPYIELPK